MTLVLFPWAQFIANVAIILTALFIFRQLRIASGHLQVAAQQFASGLEAQKQNRTIEYIRRWNESPEQAHWTQVIRFMGDSTQAEAAKLKAIEEDVDLRLHIRNLGNFFEELGLAYSKDSIDRDGTREFFSFIVKNMYGRMRFYIEHRRKTERIEKLYENFSILYGECVKYLST